MEKHDWPAVLEALQDWLADTQENEPGAENQINALEYLIGAIPEEAYE